MEAIDFLPENLGLRLFGSADLGRVHKLDGIISSFAGESLNIRGDGAKVEVQAGQQENAPRLTVSPELVSLEGVHDFSVIHPETGEVLFSTSDPELALPEGLQKLEAEEAEVSRVTAPVGEDLLVRSDANLIVRGSEGIQVEKKSKHCSKKGSFTATATAEPTLCAMFHWFYGDALGATGPFLLQTTSFHNLLLTYCCLNLS